MAGFPQGRANIAGILAQRNAAARLRQNPAQPGFTPANLPTVAPQSAFVSPALPEVAKQYHEMPGAPMDVPDKGLPYMSATEPLGTPPDQPQKNVAGYAPLNSATGPLGGFGDASTMSAMSGMPSFNAMSGTPSYSMSGPPPPDASGMNSKSSAAAPPKPAY